MNTRIYISKNIEFDSKTKAIQQELVSLNIFATAKTYSCYDIFNITEKKLELAVSNVFTDAVVEECLYELPKHQTIFAIEYLPGQYDARADAAMQCCQLLFNHNNTIIQTSLVIGLDNIDANDVEKIKHHLINTVDSREKKLHIIEQYIAINADEIKVYENFTTLTHIELETFLKIENLSIDINDLKCIQQYFIQENRNPTETEIRVLDTYWSDHCRHTTFLTQINNIEIIGDYIAEIKATLDKYLQCKKELGKENTPITLMDIATIAAKYLSSKKILPQLHHSKENNAATIEIDVDVNGINEKWLLLFKNETHNHPTEIEPFGGAATCIGGAIRDPLSGRAFVYQAMRLSGAANPLEPIFATLSSKLSQQKICKNAALGYSSYGNQIGLATTHVAEIYDEGYKAKRFECGFVIGAVKKDFVVEEDPQNGDIILLIGGATGRDGIGGASGSSKQHNELSLSTMQAEVQKGNAIVERKIQTLFRKPKISKLIKKCNDFGAGGVCVAIGEIADSIEIDLNKVPLKYNGLNGTEIAISESQERIAVVVNKKDVETIINSAFAENLIATPIAKVTDDGILRMNWNGKEIVNLKRSFLNSNGAARSVETTINIETEYTKEKIFSKEMFLETLANKSIASQKGMIEHFDSTVLATTCLMPFGGKYQLSPSDVSAQFICDNTYTTNVVSLATWGFHPNFTTANTYIGAMYSIIESVSKLVAAGAEYSKCYLSFQEYFERLQNDKIKWGKPLSALLGAFETQLQLGIAAIGGKDSMSGTFKDINVPPTFVSFAVATQQSENIVSTDFKQANNYIYLFKIKTNDKQIPDWGKLKQDWTKIHQLIANKKIVSAKHIKDGGIATTVAMMSFGNKIGATINTNKNLLNLMLGCIVFETTEKINDDFVLLGKTNDSNNLIFNNEIITINEAINNWTLTFENLFPTQTATSKNSIPNISVPSKSIASIGFGKPNILLPVFSGTNCEYETAHAFELEKANTTTLNINNISSNAIEQSINQFIKQLTQSQILVFSGGFSAADEPDGSAKFIATFLKSNKVKDAVHQFLNNDGLILGICNGFQALVKSGLLPYGNINTSNKNSPTLTHNQIGRHVSQMINVKVVNDNSPWLQGMKDAIFTIPVSHGEGRFYANDETLQQLIHQNQIATQYVNFANLPTNKFPYNPNGSLAAIEGLLSSDGKIFGRMAHPERMKKGRFKNIPNINYHNIFKNGVDYFL